MAKKVVFISSVHPDLLPPVHNIALSYAERGYQCVVVSFGYARSYGEVKHESGVTYIALEKYAGNAFRKLFHQYRFHRTIQSLSSESSDLIFAFCPVSFFHASLIFGSQRVILHCLEIFLRPKKLSFDYLFYQYFRKYINKSKKVLFPSKERADLLNKEYHLHSSPGVLLNTPYIGDSIHPVARARGNRVRLIHSGGLNDSRGILELLEGFKLVDPDHFELVITNFGRDEYSLKIKRLVETEKMENVVLKGTLTRSDLKALQASADIGICFIKPTGSTDTNLIAPNKLGEYLINNLVCLVSNQNYFDQLGKHDFIVLTDITNPSQVASSLLKSRDTLSKMDLNDQIRGFVMQEYNMRAQLVKNKLLDE